MLHGSGLKSLYTLPASVCLPWSCCELVGSLPLQSNHSCILRPKSSKAKPDPSKGRTPAKWSHMAYSVLEDTIKRQRGSCLLAIFVAFNLAGLRWQGGVGGAASFLWDPPATSAIFHVRTPRIWRENLQVHLVLAHPCGCES